jgi:2-keto-myo-inositol isomerase
MPSELSRRSLLAAGAVSLVGAAVARADDVTNGSSRRALPRFTHCLNTSTIRGQELGIVAELEIAAKAGYTAIEPWMREITTYTQAGGSLKDLRMRIDDLGLSVESAIGFAQWIVDDEAARAKGLEEAKRDMDVLAQLGGKRIAAPPTGATKQTDLDLFAAAERYRALCELGDEFGVSPQVEVWGFSTSLSRLGEAVFVAVEAGHPRACVLPDVYHVYKGGSDFAGLGLLTDSAVPCFHVNDYPADPPRDTIRDADRVFPGDGIAPLGEILSTLYAHGGCVLSLELFNPEYWKRDALAVAREGLEKTQAAVERARAAR